MAEVIYLLCAVTSLLCVYALFRGYKTSKNRLLLWTGISFCVSAGLNIFLFVDMAILPTTDLNGPLWRNVLSAMAGSILLLGLIWELT